MWMKSTNENWCSSLKAILKLVSEGWIIIFGNMDDFKEEMDFKSYSEKNYYLVKIGRIINR